jgi:aldehyde:ferredoxin oxidoreductase
MRSEMGLPGYAGNILFIDLTRGQWRKEPLDTDMARAYIGGQGINLRLARELLSPEAGPLYPQNVIILGAGPFNGTPVPGSSRLSILYKSPLNGSLVHNSGGGNFSSFLKSSGYDHLVITGRSPGPVYIKILDNDIELCNAGGLWGKDSFETTDCLRLKYEPCSIIPIGQAGENQVNISVTHIDKGGTVGSGGLAAVMGSKNLKAIVALQGTRGVAVDDPPRLERLISELMVRIREYHLREEMMQGGAMTMTAGWLPEGVLARNSSRLVPYPPRVNKIQAGIYELHKRSRQKIACISCPMSDKDRLDLAERGLSTYDTAVFAEGALMTASSAFGYRAEGSALDRYADALRYFDLVNRFGLDRLYSFPGIVDFVVTLFEDGVITRENTGGLELDREFDTLIKLVKMTAFREGLGDILADGIMGAARRLGKGTEKRIQNVVKGQFVNRDPRLWGFGPMEFEALVYPGRPLGVAAAMGAATYNPGSPVKELKKQAERCGVTAGDMGRLFNGDSFSIGRLARHGEDFFSLFNLLGQCHRLYISRFYSVGILADLYSAVTGIETTPAGLKLAAERTWNLWKMMNWRLGFDRQSDSPPEIWFEPLISPDRTYLITDYYRRKTLSREDVNSCLDEYYDERGWERTTGRPLSHKLKELGLEDLSG